MSIFDFFKRDRGYDIHSLGFCEVDESGTRNTKPGGRLFTDSRYVMPVVRMTSRIDRTVKMIVRITKPDGKVHTYDFDAPLKICENKEAHLPWWGAKDRTAFSQPGIWLYEILDEKNEVVASAPLRITTLDSLWEEEGWIHLQSKFEFRNSTCDGELIDDWGKTEFMEPRYIAMRCQYVCLSEEEREVTYSVEIRNETTGGIKRFDHTVTLDPQGGWLQMCGWGNDSGTSYSPGRHIYTLFYQERKLGSGYFEVVKSPRQRGWIEPVSLVLYCCNTENELSSWAYGHCAQTLVAGKPIEQQSFKGSYNILVAALQYRSLGSGHSIKLKYRFYVDGKLSTTQIKEHTTIQQGLLSIVFSSGLSAAGGDPLCSGTYLVEVYVETDEFEEIFVRRQAIYI